MPPSRDGASALTLLRERMNRLFDERQTVDTSGESGFAPATDVYATDDATVVAVELPGVRRDDLQIGAAAGSLVVEGNRRFSGDGAAYHRLERSYGHFRCTIDLPADANVDGRRVALAAGVLTIEIPRRR